MVFSKGFSVVSKQGFSSRLPGRSAAREVTKNGLSLVEAPSEFQPRGKEMSFAEAYSRIRKSSDIPLKRIKLTKLLSAERVKDTFSILDN